MKHPHKKLATLLVATDFSRSSGHALQRAIRLPLAAGASLRLLHVLPEGMPQKLKSRLEEKAWIRLQQIASRASKAAAAAGNASVVITPKVVYGEAYIEIIRNARMSAADLVLAGRHGRGGIRSLLIGSTAIRVIRKGDFPVLIVNKKPVKTYCRPLVAIGLEDTSRVVLDLVLQVLDPAISAIPVVHAYWPPFEGSVLARLTPNELAGYHRELKREADSDLKRILASLSDRERRWKTVVRRGDPRSAVLDEANRRGSDLIAIGTHARSGLSHVLLGSVAEWLIRAARCDVLVARPSRFSFELP